MRRSWIKLYIDQTLRGTCFDELLPDERFIWFGFLLLAGDNAIEGKISVTENMGFSIEQLSDLLKCNSELIQRAIKKMITFKKITIDKNNVIYISNWKKYQSEYQRQRDYREEYKKQKKLQREVTTTCSKESNNVKCGVDRDIERDKDKEEEKDKERKEILSVFDFWNSKKIIIHKKLDATTNTKIKNILEDYSIKEIKQSIHCYAGILESDDYYFKYRWTLKEFLQRGFEKFLDPDIAHDNYKKDRK